MKTVVKVVNEVMLLSITAEYSRYSVLLNEVEGERVVKQILNGLTMIRQEKLNKSKEE